MQAEGRPSLLEFARKEAFGCDDYGPREEDGEAFLVSPADDLMVVLEKARKLGETVLEGRSIAVAIGDLTCKQQERDDKEGIRRFTNREKQMWQLWERGYRLPIMQWQSYQPDHGETDGQEHIQRLGMERKQKQSTERSNTKRKRRSSLNEPSAWDLAALGELYRLSEEAKARVVQADVHYFRCTYPELRALMAAVGKVMQAREDCKAERERLGKEVGEHKAEESQSTRRAMYAVERQVRWIMSEANKSVEAIQEHLLLLRGRLSAVEESQGEDSCEGESEGMTEAGSIQEEPDDVDAGQSIQSTGRIEQEVVGDGREEAKAPVAIGPARTMTLNELVDQAMLMERAQQHHHDGDLQGGEEEEEEDDDDDDDEGYGKEAGGNAENQPGLIQEINADDHPGEEHTTVEGSSATEQDRHGHLDGLRGQEVQPVDHRHGAFTYGMAPHYPLLQEPNQGVRADLAPSHASNTDAGEDGSALFAQLQHASRYTLSDPVQASSSQMDNSSAEPGPADPTQPHPYWSRSLAIRGHLTRMSARPTTGCEAAQGAESGPVPGPNSLFPFSTGPKPFWSREY